MSSNTKTLPEQRSSQAQSSMLAMSRPTAGAFSVSLTRASSYLARQAHAAPAAVTKVRISNHAPFLRSPPHSNLCARQPPGGPTAAASSVRRGRPDATDAAQIRPLRHRARSLATAARQRPQRGKARKVPPGQLYVPPKGGTPPPRARRPIAAEPEAETKSLVDRLADQNPDHLRGYLILGVYPLLALGVLVSFNEDMRAQVTGRLGVDWSENKRQLERQGASAERSADA